MGFGVFDFGVLGFGVWGLGLMASRLRAYGFRGLELGLMVEGCGLRVEYLEFWVWGFKLVV